MCYKKYLSLVWALFLYLTSFGQCPARDTLWHAVTRLAEAHISTDSQFHSLLVLQDNLRKCPESPDSADAFLFQRIGVMYFKKKDFTSSVSSTFLSLDILNKQARAHPGQKFHCFWNLSIYYDSLNQPAKRNDAIDSCITVSFGSDYADSMILYPICSRIVNMFNYADYERCVQYASLGQKLAEKYGYTHSDIVRRILSWKINALILLNNYRAVGEELKDKIPEYESQKKYGYIGNLYQLWADYYLGTGKTDSALSNYKRSFEMYRWMKESASCAPPLNAIGFVLSEYKHDYPAALHYYFKSLTYSDANQSVSILSNIGNVYVRKHQFDSAFYYFQKAFDQISPGFNETALLNRRHVPPDNLAEYILNLVLDKADAHLCQYRASGKEEQLNQTLVSYRTADQVLDKINHEQSGIQSKLSWRKSIRRLYEHAIETAWLAKNAQEGLYFFEKSRAVLLDDQLRQEQLMQNRESADQYELKKTINELENKLDTTNPGSDLYPRLEAEIIRKKEELDGLITKINAKDPLYFAKNQGNDNMMIAEIQKSLLQDHSAVFEIFNGDSSLFTLTITSSGSNISRINKFSFDSLSQQFLSAVSNPVFLNNHYAEFTGISRSFYEMIFGDHELPAGRIIISPDGISIPFEALISKQDPDPHYMLNDYSISYTYSARYLMNRFTRSTDESPADFMGMAPVNYAPYLHLSSLTGSDISLGRIKSHFNEVYTAVNSMATKNNFLRNFTKYRIVQLYSHAVYDTTTGKPLIYFADSSLDLSELFSAERPAARLILLSACETALGTNYKGEGVFSFNREFAALGIPASISNIWSVDNDATYRITELFYGFISGGMPTDLALQKAKLQFIKEATGEKLLPFYWASPILTGKTDIIKTTKTFPYQYVVLLIFIAGLIFWILYRQKNHLKPK